MSLDRVRVGVLDIELPVRSDNIMGSLSGITPEVCVVSKDVDNSLEADANPSLSTSDIYTFVMALGGEDRVNGGYTIARASEITAAVSPADANDVIRLRIPDSSLPANFEEAAFMAIFVKINSITKYQLCKLAYVPDDGNDFETCVAVKPIRSAPKFDLSLLQSATSAAKLGSREPYGFTFEKVEPTEGAINEVYNVSTANLNPNNGPPVSIRTTIAAGLEFNLLLNDIKSIVRAAGGIATTYDSENGTDIITEGSFALATAQAILKGNQPVRVTYPPDGFGNSEIGIYFGLRTNNDAALTLSWNKDGSTPVTINYQTFILDGLLISQHARISFLRRTVS